MRIGAYRSCDLKQSDNVGPELCWGRTRVVKTVIGSATMAGSTLFEYWSRLSIRNWDAVPAVHNVGVEEAIMEVLAQGACGTTDSW